MQQVFACIHGCHLQFLTYTARAFVVCMHFMEVGSIFELSVSLGPGGPYFLGISVRGVGGGGGAKIASDRNAYDTGFRNVRVRR